MKSLIEKIQLQFQQGSMAIKLIMVNVGFFAITALVSILIKSFNPAIQLYSYIGASSSFLHTITRPWTLLTYMFSHDLTGIGHLFWNMVLLYFAGNFFVTKLGNRKLLSVYLMGGLAGYLLFSLLYSFLPAFSSFPPSPLIGASASVLAVFVAIGIMNPNYPLKFVFLSKPIKLIYIVGGVVLLDLVRLQASMGVESSNAGGWIAHMGGAIFGLIYGIQLKEGKNILKGFEKVLDTIFSFSLPKKGIKPKLKVKKGGAKKDSPKKESNKAKEGVLMEAILEKVKKSGYDSLTKREKELFFSKTKR